MKTKKQRKQEAFEEYKKIRDKFFGSFSNHTPEDTILKKNLYKQSSGTQNPQEPHNSSGETTDKSQSSDEARKSTSVSAARVGNSDSGTDVCECGHNDSFHELSVRCLYGLEFDDKGFVLKEGCPCKKFKPKEEGGSSK